MRWIGLLVCLGVAHASPVLVAVDVPTREATATWVGAGYPTRAYVWPTAFAVVEMDEVERIRGLGLGAEVVASDLAGWTYWVGQPTGEPSGGLGPEVVWRRGRTLVVRSRPGEEGSVLAAFPHLHPLPERPLPAEFWAQLVATWVPLRSVPWHPLIQAVVDRVHADSLTTAIRRLQDFGSRLILGDSSYAASQWILQRFSSWGYPARFDSFYISRPVYGNWPGIGWERNVIARKAGTGGAGPLLVIGGHFDSIVWSDTAVARVNAPGADDNASGAAGALEAARVLKDFPMEKDVEFAAWGAEEIGLVGSTVYVMRALQSGTGIAAMVNMDMTGYVDDGRLDCMIQYVAPPLAWFGQLFKDVAHTYVPQLDVVALISSGGSDWYPFAMAGIPAVGAAELARSHFNPHYHSTTDRLETLTPELYVAITKACVATVAVMGVCPGPVAGVVARDLGDGVHLRLEWAPSPEPDVVGYRVWWGTASQTYVDSVDVGVGTTSVVLGDLVTGATYYFVVRAVDDDGYQSYLAQEVTGVPRVVPQAPQGVVAIPLPGGILVSWRQNPEADVVRYHVRRRVDQGSMMPLAQVNDTSYVDAGLSGAHRYYYAVVAEDSTGNTSPPSSEAYGRPITLDQGILVVDETRNHASSPDSTVDAFYRGILRGFRVTEFEFGSAEEAPLLADLGPYSSVVWHADDFAQFLASAHVDKLRQYLDAGGHLWFVGWKPSANLAGSSSYPMTFAPGSFMYDYMGISAAQVSGQSDSLVGVRGEGGFPDMMVDPSAVPVPAWGGTLRYVEAWTPTPSTEVVCRAVMASGPFQNAVCGVKKAHVVFFGFPLSCMDEGAATEAARRVMQWFGEPASAPGELKPHQLCLHVHPNPSQGTFTISFLAPGGLLEARLFDVAGRLVKTLKDGHTQPGWQVLRWDGTSEAGTPCGSGVYVCTVRSGLQATRKVLVLAR